MRCVPLAGICILSATLAAPAAADVTIRQKSGGKGVGGAMAGETTQYLKGARMRTDQNVGGTETSVIIDADAQQMIVLDHKRRQAEVHDMRALAGELSKIAAADIEARIEATTETRQLAGHSCTVHTMQVAVPMQMGGDTMSIVMKGPVCLAKGVPGEADYAAFFRTAAEKGLFFGDPRVAKAQPGQARGMSELYRQMASRGVPLATEIQIAFQGAGPMAAMMSKLGGSSFTSEVTSISSETLDAALFQVPDGFKTVER